MNVTQGKITNSGLLTEAGVMLPKVGTPEDLKQKVAEYFCKCHENMDDDNGKLLKPYTMSGLAFHLGISRRVLLRYESEENRRDYWPIVAYAKARIEAFAEEQLYTNKNVSGVSFILKNNHGWKDQVDLYTPPRENQIKQVSGDMSEADAFQLYMDMMNLTHEQKQLDAQEQND